MRAGNASTNYTMYLTNNDENTPHLIVRGDSKILMGGKSSYDNFENSSTSQR